MPAVNGNAQHFWGPQAQAIRFVPPGGHSLGWDVRHLIKTPERSPFTYSAALRGGKRSWILNISRVFKTAVGLHSPLGSEAAAVSQGRSPASQPAASCHLLSQLLDRESTLSIWDAMRPSFLVYSSWQAKLCVMHDQTWEHFLFSGTERQVVAAPASTLCCGVPWAPGARVVLHYVSSRHDHRPLYFLVWDCWADSVQLTCWLLSELMNVSWVVVMWYILYDEVFTQFCWEFTKKVRNRYV